MSEIGEILSMQECPEDGDDDQVKEKTLEDFLIEEEEMDGGDQTPDQMSNNHNPNHNSRRRRRWLKIMQHRLRFKGMACCGATWGGFKPVSSTIVATVDEEHGEEFQEESTPEATSTTVVGSEIQTAAPGMNLAMALAAERHLRAAQEGESGGGGAGEEGGAAVARVSLLRLLEEEEEEKEVGNDRVCCVCMGRNKGAAFIPCGHTFCRACSRDLWLNRGSCPLCNRIITDVLDIY